MIYYTYPMWDKSIERYISCNGLKVLPLYKSTMTQLNRSKKIKVKNSYTNRR